MIKSSVEFTVPEVINQFRSYFEKRNAWGPFHVVLENQNVEDTDVQECIDHYIVKGDTESLSLGNILLKLSSSQRLRISELI